MSHIKEVSIKSSMNVRKVFFVQCKTAQWKSEIYIYEGWNFNSGNYLFTTDTK